MASSNVNANAKTLPLTSALTKASTTSTDISHNKLASNSSHGTDNTLRVAQVLEEHGILMDGINVSEQ